MPSGAGHDAQMFAPRCPSAMIFVPSKDGISHNIQEYTAPEDLVRGARLLAEVALDRAGVSKGPKS
ncbi:Beta-ureidopropionase [Salipiger mucosus DSM 16094]|uniref:Beta-ureidopropionase n=2 Tax=Salipiger mucosus TaxID=263378 RepID=S9RRK1_9RHOB|nr:Beta-ureidopropionase [Salipiger mucosus DSM 16094]